jgi:hypothetical protein
MELAGLEPATSWVRFLLADRVAALLGYNVVKLGVRMVAQVRTRLGA